MCERVNTFVRARRDRSICEHAGTKRGEQRSKDHVRGAVHEAPTFRSPAARPPWRSPSPISPVSRSRASSPIRAATASPSASASATTSASARARRVLVDDDGTSTARPSAHLGAPFGALEPPRSPLFLGKSSCSPGLWFQLSRVRSPLLTPDSAPLGASRRTICRANEPADSAAIASCSPSWPASVLPRDREAYRMRPPSRRAQRSLTARRAAR